MGSTDELAPYAVERTSEDLGFLRGGQVDSSLSATSYASCIAEPIRFWLYGNLLVSFLTISA